MEAKSKINYERGGNNRRTNTAEEKRVSVHCYGHIQQLAGERFTEIRVIANCVTIEIKETREEAVMAD